MIKRLLNLIEFNWNFIFLQIAISMKLQLSFFIKFLRDFIVFWSLWKFYIPILLFNKEDFEPSPSSLRALCQNLGLKLHVFFKILSILGQKKARQGPVLRSQYLWKLYIPILFFHKEHFEPSSASLNALYKNLGSKWHVLFKYWWFWPK